MEEFVLLASKRHPDFKHLPNPARKKQAGVLTRNSPVLTDYHGQWQQGLLLQVPERHEILRYFLKTWLCSMPRPCILYLRNCNWNWLSSSIRTLPVLRMLTRSANNFLPLQGASASHRQWLCHWRRWYLTIKKKVNRLINVNRTYLVLAFLASQHSCYQGWQQYWFLKDLQTYNFFNFI